MPLEDIIKMNKKKRPETRAKRGGNRKFVKPVVVRRNKGKEGSEGPKSNQKNTQNSNRAQQEDNKGSKFIRRTKAKAEAAPKKQPVNKTALRISNLDFNISHKDLMDLFSQFGPIVKNKIDFDELGRSKGTALIQYAKPESAVKAINEYDGATLDGKQLIVEYVKSQPKPQSTSSEVPGIRNKIIKKIKDKSNFGFSNRRQGDQGGRRDQGRGGQRSFRKRGGGGNRGKGGNKGSD